MQMETINGINTTMCKTIMCELKGKKVKTIEFVLNNVHTGYSWYNGRAGCGKIYFNSSLIPDCGKQIRPIQIELVAANCDNLSTTGANGFILLLMDYEPSKYNSNHTIAVKRHAKCFLDHYEYIGFAGIFNGVVGKNNTTFDESSTNCLNLFEYRQYMNSLNFKLMDLRSKGLNPGTYGFRAILRMKYVN